MNCTGKITNISRDWKTNKLNITFSLNERVEGEIDKIKDCEKLSIKAVRFRKKRSLDANAYMLSLIHIQMCIRDRTDTQWKDMLRMLLEILQNEEKEKAIEFIQSLLNKQYEKLKPKPQGRHS